MRSLILNFFLLVLRISFDLSSNTGQKSGRFSETLLEKSIEFILNKGAGIVIFKMDLVLFPAKVDPISEK